MRKKNSSYLKKELIGAGLLIIVGVITTLIVTALTGERSDSKKQKETIIVVPEKGKSTSPFSKPMPSGMRDSSGVTCSLHNPLLIDTATIRFVGIVGVEKNTNGKSNSKEVKNRKQLSDFPLIKPGDTLIVHLDSSEIRGVDTLIFLCETLEGIDRRSDPWSIPSPFPDVIGPKTSLPSNPCRIKLPVEKEWRGYCLECEIVNSTCTISENVDQITWDGGTAAGNLAKQLPKGLYYARCRKCGAIQWIHSESYEQD